MRRAIGATNPAPAGETSANRLFSIPVAIQSTLHPVAHANAAQDWTIEDRMYPPRTAALQSPPARPANGARTLLANRLNQWRRAGGASEAPQCARAPIQYERSTPVTAACAKRAARSGKSAP